MRDIKFRAWDKQNKLMLHDAGITGIRVPGGVKVKQVIDGAVHNAEGQFVDSLFADAIDMEFMQYTGLKDKNGKEIYEGDIIEVTQQKHLARGDERFYLNGRKPFAVKWTINAYHNGWNIYRGRTTQYEVIGNIYENPELLI